MVEPDPKHNGSDAEMQPPLDDATAADEIELSATQRAVLDEWLRDPFQSKDAVIAKVFPDLNRNQRRRRVGTIFNNALRAFVIDMLKIHHSSVLDAESSVEIDPAEKISMRSKEDQISLYEHNLTIARRNKEIYLQAQQRPETRSNQNALMIMQITRQEDAMMKAIARLQGLDKVSTDQKRIPAVISIQRAVNLKVWKEQHGIDAVEEVAGKLLPYNFEDVDEIRKQIGEGRGYDVGHPPETGPKDEDST